MMAKMILMTSLLVTGIGKVWGERLSFLGALPFLVKGPKLNRYFDITDPNPHSIITQLSPNRYFKCFSTLIASN